MSETVSLTLEEAADNRILVGERADAPAPDTWPLPSYNLDALDGLSITNTSYAAGGGLYNRMVSVVLLRWPEPSLPANAEITAASLFFTPDDASVAGYRLHAEWYPGEDWAPFPGPVLDDYPYPAPADIPAARVAFAHVVAADLPALVPVEIPLGGDLTHYLRGVARPGLRIWMETDAPLDGPYLSLVQAGGGDWSPRLEITYTVPDPPPVLPRRPTRFRLYDGQFGAGTISKVPATSTSGGGRGGSSTGSNEAAAGGALDDTSLAVTLPQSPRPGNTVILTVAWQGSGSITYPAGFSVAVQNTAGAVKGAILYKLVATGETGSYSLAATGALSVSVVAEERLGVLTASPVDATASGSGTGFALSTGTSGATTQASEAVIVGFAHAAGWPLLGGTGGYIRGLNGGGAPNLVTASKNLVATGTQSALASTPESGAWVALLATFKSDAAAAKCLPVGEFVAATGEATMEPWAIGSLSLSIPRGDPLARVVQPGQFVEVVHPTITPSWWYQILHVEEDETDVGLPLRVQGHDLRHLVGLLAISTGNAAAARGAVAPALNTEGILRAYIYYSAIAPAGVDYPTAQKVYGLSLEGNGLAYDAGYNRGDAYAADQWPLAAGAPLVETAAALLRRASLGWRVVVVDAGTASATMQVQVYAGTDRVIGNEGEAVFAVQWGTARGVRRVRDAVGALTAAVVRGPVDGDTRPRQYVEDGASIQQWGLRFGEIDAGNEELLTEAIAREYLADRLPKAFVEVVPRDLPRLTVGTHYGLLDQVTALTTRGERYDGLVTALTVREGDTSPALSFGSAMRDLFPRDGLPLPGFRTGAESPAALTMQIGLGLGPAAEGGTSRAAALREDYTNNPTQVAVGTLLAAADQTIAEDSYSVADVTAADTQSVQNAVDAIVNRLNTWASDLNTFMAAVVASSPPPATTLSAPSGQTVVSTGTVTVEAANVASVQAAVDAVTGWTGTTVTAWNGLVGDTLPGARITE